jgi:hypothetical protein
MGLISKDYVPLDRRFERASANDTVDHWLEILAEREIPHDWAWLRAQSRVVALLAQAGSGKTVEFMHQVDEARSVGRDAFFFRVERLCSGPFEDAHETPDCKSRFSEWVQGKRPAEIFLDAVDEAKLPQSRTARPLRDALRALNFVLGSHFDRVSIFVSCRSSEWFDDIEQKALDELAERLGTNQTIDVEPIVVFNATFAPLDLGRVRVLAEGRGGEEAVAMLIESEAITDIITPLDAILYLETYLEFKGTPDLAARFASRGKLLETSVRRRLLEQGGETRRSQVEFSTGLRAAQFLAFASIVAQTMDLAVGGPRKDCIDPQELLASGHAGLSSDGIRQLLACSLFVPAGQARVRFYRREARDMLAAQWLRDRIDEGASALAITDRFIKFAFGKPRVPTIYGSMLSWLASYDPVTRRRMIQAAPEWIIEGGDPRSLALEDRIAALNQHFRLGPHRFHGEFMFEVGELRRFARPELDQAIVAHLVPPPEGDLFDHLMQIVEAGRFASAAPHLVDLLNDFTRSSGDRLFAIRALIASGNADDLRAVAQHFTKTGGPTVSADEMFARGRNDHFLIDLVMAAYPRAISVDEAIALFAQLHGKEFSHEAKVIASWLADAPSADLEAWLVGLDGLCFDVPDETYKPFGHSTPPLRRPATMLLRGLLEIAARYIRETDRFEFERDLLVYDRLRHATSLGGTYSMSRRGSPVPAALTESAKFRHALYEKIAAVEGHKLMSYVYLDHVDRPHYRGEPHAEDIRWLLSRYRESSGEIREGYIQTAAFLADRYDRPQRIRARLNIIRAAIFHRERDWSPIRQVTIDPLLAPWRRYRIRRRYKRHDPESRIREFLTRSFAAVRRQWAIWRNWAGLRQGKPVNLLEQLVLDGRFEPPSEAELIERVGVRLGSVLITGAKAYAREYRPIERGRSVFGIDILAQAGIRYNWNADPAMPGIDPAAALHAALLFATDWPEWATGLALDNPDATADLIVPLLAADLSSARMDEFGHYSRFLSTISHRDEAIRALLSAPLYRAIASIRVITGPDIDQLVRILRANPEIESLLPGFAARHAREAWQEGAKTRALGWIPFWAEKDHAGLQTLLRWMADDPSLIPQGLGIYVRIFGERSGAVPPPLDVRARFADFAYAHIRPVEDTPAKEGVHTTTERDNLQHLRGNVGELLSINFDPAERHALEDLLTRYIAPVSTEWADRWRNRYEQRSVKPRAWSHAMILETAEEFAAAPTSGDELFARVSDMISDLEMELEGSEFDRRGLFPASILEADFRAWLGHALDSRRRPWFSIVQEAETSGAARTDLRIELRATGNALVIVEIKLLHGWKYEELLDKFRSQLVDRYLLTDRVRHGIYLIVDLGKKPKGSLPNGTTPGSDEIAAILNEEARALADSDGRVAKAQVFKVEPSKRNRRRAAKGDVKQAEPATLNMLFGSD